MTQERTTGELTTKQRGALEALLIEPTQTQAAARAGVSRSQLSRWLREPVFMATYRAERVQLWQHTIGNAQRAAAAALACLVGIISDKKASGAARVAASRAVLELCHRAEIENLTERIERLEAAAERG